ncbi:hypothetical protein AC578_11124 [Pseudocercospora eumusae]|uniref:Uncharacterized protein n=1 Tax=Pseudocercospora eumusae TaxID=321146 RepID=A0A139H295_9PEZI|nr:hypothetical protein AC578_11124 [Pseudocercospora eumusae]
MEREHQIFRGRAASGSPYTIRTRMTQHGRSAHGASQGTKRRSNTATEPPRKSKSPTKWDQDDDSTSRSRGSLRHGNDAEQQHPSERSQGDKTIPTSEAATHGFKHTMEATNEALGHCLMILSGDTIPPLLEKPTTQTILDDLILPKIRLSQPASIRGAFADLRCLLDAYRITGARAERVMVMLRTEIRKILDELTTAVMDTEDTGSVHPSASESEAHGFLGPASLSHRNGVQCAAASALAGSQDGSEDDATTSLELQGAARDIDGTLASSIVQSSPQSVRVHSRFFPAGSGTDGRSTEPDAAIPDHSNDENTRSPTQRKLNRREWSHIEEDKGIRRQRPSKAMAKNLAMIGAARTSATHNRRTVLQKRHPREDWASGAPSADGDRTSKNNAWALANAAAKSVGKGSTRASVASDSSSEDHFGEIVTVKWHCCLPSSDEPDLFVFYLPIGTPEIPVAPESNEATLELEQACLEAFKGGGRSFQSVEQRANDFWVVSCKAPRFGHREIMECPVLFRGFHFFPEYLPLQPPKTFTADIEQDITDQELVLSLTPKLFNAHFHAHFAVQVDAASSSRKIVAYFVHSPGLMRFYIYLGPEHSELCFKPVEIHGTCWLCSQEHGDRRCAMDMPLQ